MKQMIKAIATICLVLLPTFAMDTDVGGIIDSDTIWTLANSPYNITPKQEKGGKKMDIRDCSKDNLKKLYEINDEIDHINMKDVKETDDYERLKFLQRLKEKSLLTFISPIYFNFP